MGGILQTRQLIQEIELIPLLINVILGLVMGQLLAWHYLRYAKVSSNKRKFAGLLVALTLTTLLVISVIKTSLALSLGMVGALSIIRFRTPVKEPEELVYLFMAIAVGIGIGADQRLVTLIIFSILLLYVGVSKGISIGPGGPGIRSLVQVTMSLGSEETGSLPADEQLQKLLAAAEAQVSDVDVRRVDTHGNEFNVSLLVDIPEETGVAPLLSGIREALPSASVTVVDRETFE
jgi:hypothetical protein